MLRVYPIDPKTGKPNKFHEVAKWSGSFGYATEEFQIPSPRGVLKIEVEKKDKKDRSVFRVKQINVATGDSTVLFSTMDADAQTVCTTGHIDCKLIFECTNATFAVTAYKEIVLPGERRVDAYAERFNLLPSKPKAQSLKVNKSSIVLPKNWNPKAKAWVNTESNLYHIKGCQWFGNTRRGYFCTVEEAQKAGAKFHVNC